MPEFDTLSIDYETFSELSLTDVGTSVYANHASTEILMCAYALNDSPVRQWVPAEGEPMPKHLKDALVNPRIIKRAWNANFEIAMTRACIGPVDVKQWRCTMVQAMSCSLPGKLEKAGPVLNVPINQLKDSRGKALMRKFSFPRKPSKRDDRTRIMWHEDPEEWVAYKEYNVSDVEAERAIARRLRQFDMSEDEWDLWFMDHEINVAGLPINRAMVDNAITIYEQVLEESFEEMRQITGLANPNSGPQLLPWLQAHGYMFTDLKKGHIETANRYFKERPEHWDHERWDRYRGSNSLKRVLELRRDTSRTSIKKYYALQRATDNDGMLRFTLQMNGAARTGRWGGRLYQPQNLVKPEKRFEEMQPQIADAIEHLDADGIKMLYGNPFDVLATGIRTSAQAPEGYVFIDADLSAIENRVLGWLAGCNKILAVFRNNMDPYISFATYLYDQPYDKLYHEYKVEKKGAKRTIAKPGTLGCGYGMGAGEAHENDKTGEIEATGLLGYAWNMGVRHFTQEDAKHSVDTFRREFSEVKEYWYDIERAMRRCIKSQKEIRHGVIRFTMDGPFLNMWLPSGRPLRYLRPRLENKLTPWGETRLQITYEGLNDRKQWVRMHTTPGKVTENADQAISRDLLVHGMKLAQRRGLNIRLHVHDQLVGLAKEDEAEAKLALLMECMNETPRWAEGLPLGSAGQIAKVMIKD